MILPSKELLSEVLKLKVKDIYKIGSNPNFGENTLLFSIVGNGELQDINIYELIHKMKEYILKNYQIMGTYYSTSICGWCCWIDDLGNKGIAKTEFDAVVEACTWIHKELQCQK